VPRIFESRNKIFFIILVVLFILTAVIWFSYYAIGFSNFNKETAVSIHDSVIQGISGFAAVAIAVIIFRIQSLETRNQLLEQSTLNYISQTLGWSYPEWTSTVEDDIRNKTLTNRYYAHLPSKADKLVIEERDRQQKKLEETLNLHSRIRQTIRRIRNDVLSSMIFLITPVLCSLLLLTVADLLDNFWNFVSASIVVLLCALGILLLIKMTLESTVKES
jgi:hypothetical protein